MNLLQEIARGENVALEFKEARPKDALKFVKTVVAFANGRGGRLLFGVEDGTGVVKGIDRTVVQKEMDAIADTIANACTPRINPKMMLANVDGKSVVVVDVPQGDCTPYYVRKLGLRKGVFQRVGATTREVEEYTLKDLILQGKNLSFDRQTIRGLKIGKRDLASVCRLMTECARKNCENEGRSLDVKAMTATRLESMGLLVDCDGTKKSSNALALIAGWTIPDLMVPKIRCAVFKGKDKVGDFLDHADYDGPLAEQIENAFQFVKRNLRLQSTFTEANTVRKDRYELPLVSVREAICNAVFHRNYLEPANIYVALYDDRLEIISPGGLLRDITLEEVKAGYSKIRNRGIAEALVYMHEVENWGGGVARYYARCAELGLPPPLVEERGGCFTVVFYRKDVVNGVVNNGVNGVVNNGAGGAPIDMIRRDNRISAVVRPQVGNEGSRDPNEPNDPNCEPNEPNGASRIILIALTKDPSTTIPDLMEVCHVSRATIKRTLKTLKDARLIRRKGGTRGHWEVLT